mgnify:CR=1 FL=1
MEAVKRVHRGPRPPPPPQAQKLKPNSGERDPKFQGAHVSSWGRIFRSWGSSLGRFSPSFRMWDHRDKASVV